jgi:hypothetical protein
LRQRANAADGAAKAAIDPLSPMARAQFDAERGGHIAYVLDDSSSAMEQLMRHPVWRQREAAQLEEI